MTQHFIDPSWDKWKRFHAFHDHHHMTLFDTGELIVNSYGTYDPDQRGRPNKWGVEFLRPDDDAPVLKRLYADKACTVPVLKTWLTSNTYMVDWERSQVVTISRNASMHVMPTGVPEWFRRTGFRAYCGGGDQDWISPSECVYSQPVRFTREQKAHLANLKKACMAMDRLEALPKNIWAASGNVSAKVRYGHAIPQCFLETAFEDMIQHERMAVARNPWAEARDEHGVPSLWVGSAEGK
jgi:hypothetical protein